MNKLHDFDFAILGGGSAGYAAARTAAELGLKAVVIDGAEELSGLCILRGCMPSKTLIESANRNLTLRRAAEFGLSATTGPADTKFIRDRKRGLIGEFADYRTAQLEDGRFELIRGSGRIEEATENSVKLAIRLRGGSDATITAGSLLIATGSVIDPPPVPGLRETGFWTSDTLLDAAAIPESFVVLGAGAIALEMAHFLEGIGRRVTIVQRSTEVLTCVDADAARVVRESFEKRGMEVICGTRLESAGLTSSGKRVTFLKDGRSQTVEAAEILFALGRSPALNGLGLDRAGVSLAASGRIAVEATQQSTHPRIFAAGDVCGPLEVVHLAIQQGETAAHNAAALLRGKSPVRTVDYRCKLMGIFTHPQVATVGLLEREAQSKGVKYLAASHPFNDHGKSLVMGETEGFVKLLADAENGMLLGGAVVGPEATELIHEIAVAMHLGATVEQLAAAPHYHPTLGEIWTYPAEELAGLVKK